MKDEAQVVYHQLGYLWFLDLYVLLHVVVVHLHALCWHDPH
jgi:hypothetical protein